jgi:hypothetical protein
MVVEKSGWEFECSFCAKAGAWNELRSSAIVSDLERFSAQKPCSFG